MARPGTAPVKKLKDGFYIEIKDPGERSGIKIQRDTKEEIDRAIEMYKSTKNVEFLGEIRSGKWQEGSKMLKKKKRRK